MLAERVKDVDQNLQQRESTFNFLVERGVPSEFATPYGNIANDTKHTIFLLRGKGVP